MDIHACFSGESYVSLDYALSYHGLVPERGETITSVTTRRSRSFHTPLGSFSYRMLKEPRYALGATLESVDNATFLMASAEKALADKVWADKGISGLGVADYGGYLSEDLRIEQEALGNLDRSRLQEIALAYNSVKINNLLKYLEGFGGGAPCMMPSAVCWTATPAGHGTTMSMRSGRYCRKSLCWDSGGASSSNMPPFTGGQLSGSCTGWIDIPKTWAFPC